MPPDLSRFNVLKKTSLLLCFALSVGLAACSSSGPSSSSSSTDPESESPSSVVESGASVCPRNIVIQTDWWPELEHGGTYQLIGTRGVINKTSFRYSGPIQPQYGAGGVETVEIRAGGDAIGTSVTNEIKTDDSITFAYVTLGGAMKVSASSPVVGVAKTLEIDPQILYWDPSQTTITGPTDLKKSSKTVNHFDGMTYIDWFISQDYMSAAQSNPSYTGAPSDWISQGGDLVQQGFATNEVYKYENIYKWKNGAPAPVQYALLSDWGFPDYPAMLSVRADKLASLTPCLKVLIPKIQSAWVDYLNEPTPITDLITTINDSYDTFWKTSPELNAAGLKILELNKMAANSKDGTYCSFDKERVASMAGILGDLFVKRGVQVADDLTAVVTNEFCANAPGRDG